MRNIPHMHKIKANDGCVIYFPSRESSNVISGRNFTRRRFGEEWVQFSLDHIEVEIRFEGDNAVQMGNGLQAELAVKLVTRIDDSLLDKTTVKNSSLNKVVNKFRCVTTADTNVILGKAFFQRKIHDILKEAIYIILKEASYMKLLTDPTHRDELQRKLSDTIAPVLIDSGFLMIDCTIQRFMPIDPGIIRIEKEIVDLWSEWEKQQKRLEADKKFIDAELGEENKRRVAEAKQKTDEYARELELKEDEALKQYEERRKELEIERAEIRKDKELRIAEINEEAKEKHREYQQREISFKNQLEEDEIERKRKIEEEEVSSQYKKEQDKIAHDDDLRKREMEGLSEAIKQYELREKLTQVKTKIEKLEGFVETELLEAKHRADNYHKKELLELETKMLKEVFGQLPSIFSKIPVDNTSEKTIIQFSGDGQMPTNINAMAALFWPMLNELLGSLSKKFSSSSVELYSKNNNEEETKEVSTNDEKSRSPVGLDK